MGTLHELQVNKGYQMANNNRYTCPMCSGEGKLSADVFDPHQAERMVMYAIIITILFLGSGFLYWVTTPSAPRVREPSAVELCSTACGPGRFKAYTDARPRRESADGSRYLEAEPGKCECAEVKP